MRILHFCFILSFILSPILEYNNQEILIENFEIIENVEYVYRRLVPFSMNVNELFRMNTMYVSKEEIPLIIKGENFKNNEDFEIIA